MKNKFSKFLELHQQEDPLLIGNVWNVESAKAFENSGYSALGTSSAAIAECLGYADGEEISFKEYLFLVERISKSINLPLSVDLEGGYGKDCTDIINNIIELSELGVTGINIEDSIVLNGKRTIVDPVAFADKLRVIVRTLKDEGIDIFINVRSDTYLMGMENAKEESLRRIDMYQQVGIHGIFLPCITNLDDIESIAAVCALPLNVMCMPGLPDFEELKKAGVKRISMGSFIYKYGYAQIGVMAKKIKEANGFQPVFK